MDEHDDFSIANSPPSSLKQTLRNSICFSCCFPHRRPPPPPPQQPPSSDQNPALIWVNSEESSLKNKVLGIFSFSNRHKRHSSTDQFRYDPLSYSLNFEDGFDDDEQEAAPLRNFSSRLPNSPPARGEVAAAS
ncbi:hypothetical protein P3S67_008621 [Capsicum chacoense]